MILIKLFRTVGWVASVCGLFSCVDQANTITSPDGQVSVDVIVDNGKIFYTVKRNDEIVLENSRLGLSMVGANFEDDLKLKLVSKVEPIAEEYRMAQGKQRKILFKANRRVYRFENDNALPMELIFQVADDGVAFRYFFSEESDTVKTILSEVTSFNLPDSAVGFLQPMSVAKTGWSKVNPCYEEFYEKGIEVGARSRLGAGWVFPALFKTGENWMLITESDVDEKYCGARLSNNAPGGEYTITFPDSLEAIPGEGVLPSSRLPWETPWRVITIGALKTIVESNLALSVAEPSIDIDTTFIHPGHSSWSWALLKDDSTVYEVQKRFIDYAADMDWEYCLIDADWDRKIGYDNTKQLADYAKSKNVGLLLWYNSAGNWNETPYTPKHKLLTTELRAAEFQKLQQMGIKGIKIDFFGGDARSMIKYYHEILSDAAKYKLLVNFHGATLPRGWHRTYPHLMSAEAIKGFEYVTFEQANADEQPSHCTVIPFTRNVFDPMDFTPLSLDTIPRITRRTTKGFELALPVIFLSGIQHFAETPGGMKAIPDEAKDYLRKLPVIWDETRFIAGYPGKDFVVARRSGPRWYVSGINGEPKEKTFQVDLSFIEGKNFMIINDIDKKRLELKRLETVKTIRSITVRGNGGFVMMPE